MPIRRIFIDWERPALEAAAEHLAERFGAAGEIDLAGVVVALPGARAGRRLLEILVDLAQRRGVVLAPPKIVTVGALPELVYRAKRPFADALVQQLAWIEALRRSEPEPLARLALAPPEQGDLFERLAVGEMLARLHGELAADGLSCQKVADAVGRLSPPADLGRDARAAEAIRWRALAHVQECYLKTLDALGFWDRQTARLYAIEHRECRTDDEIVLVGTVDLNLSQRRMLDQVADRVTALVFAPERLADRFDEHGCLRAETWQDVPIPLADGQIEVVNTPADQAKAVVRAIAGFGGRFSSEEITLGVLDERVIPYVQQQLEQCGVAARYGAGTPIAQSPPWRLLSAAADYLESGRFSALAALVRHPAVDAWLLGQDIRGDWLSRLDRYQGERLPFSVDPRRLAEADESGTLGEVCRAVQDWLAELAAGARPLDQWGRPIAELLVAVFGRTPLEPTAADRTSAAADRAVLAACEAVRDVLVSHAAVPNELAPKLKGAEALRLVLRQTASESIAPPPDRDAVEMLGWLELVLDDAPALVVTGLNEGIVPSSLNADLFLPNRLRRALGLEDNQRRYARDAYALCVLAAARRALKLIAGRTAAEGEPLYPSRLLFACDGEAMVRRVGTFFHADGPPAAGLLVPGILRPPLPQSQFAVPPPKLLDEPVASMRVTEFRDYLACPYRYYLRHRLKLETSSDQAEELDPLGFGLLVHEVLGEFGGGPLRETTDPAQIEAQLNDALERLVRRRFGRTALPAVRVQVEQLRARLAAFARWQADWAGQGWRIELIEQGPAEGAAALVVDGRPMFLRGRIDRIDRHEPSGRRVILDYKSSDTAASPDKIHRSKDGWIDLQLPLYRHLAAGMGIEGPFDLGYVVLPKDTSRTGHVLAEWNEDELKEADAVAADVVRGVRAGVFWPPASPPPPFFDEYAAICQEGQFGSPPALEGEGDPPA